MAVVLVLPVLGILSVLVLRGSPGISLDFLLEDPRNGMKEGGIYPALIGTLWLTSCALAVALPLGVSAAIYLTEYARDNWFTRQLHNEAALVLQRRLHLHGLQMIILPMKL